MRHLLSGRIWHCTVNSKSGQLMQFDRNYMIDGTCHELFFCMWFMCYVNFLMTSMLVAALLIIYRPLWVVMPVSLNLWLRATPSYLHYILAACEVKLAFFPVWLLVGIAEDVQLCLISPFFDHVGSITWLRRGLHVVKTCRKCCSREWSDVCRKSVLLTA